MGFDSPPLGKTTTLHVRVQETPLLQRLAPPVDWEKPNQCYEVSRRNEGARMACYSLPACGGLSLCLLYC
jgi:hypothetical protein